MNSGTVEVEIQKWWDRVVLDHIASFTQTVVDYLRGKPRKWFKEPPRLSFQVARAVG